MSRYVYLVSKTEKYKNKLHQSSYVFTNKKDALHKLLMERTQKMIAIMWVGILSGKKYAEDEEKDTYYCQWLEEDFSEEYFYITFKKVKLEKGEDVVEYSETFAFKKGEENEKEDK